MNINTLQILAVKEPIQASIQHLESSARKSGSGNKLFSSTANRNLITPGEGRKIDGYSGVELYRSE